MNIENLSEDTLRLMDQVTASLCANVLSENALIGDIRLAGLDLSKPSHKLYLVEAEQMAALMNKKVYIPLPLFSYLWFRIKRWKYYKAYKRMTDIRDNDTLVDTILDHVAHYHKIGNDFYEAIYNAYYKIK